MPVFLAALIGGLVSAAGSFAGRVMIALGITFVAYQGIDTLMDQFVTMFQNSAAGLPASIAGMLGVLKIGTGVNIILSACIARFTLNGMTSGTIKRMVFK